MQTNRRELGSRDADGRGAAAAPSRWTSDAALAVERWRTGAREAEANSEGVHFTGVAAEFCFPLPAAVTSAVAPLTFADRAIHRVVYSPARAIAASSLLRPWTVDGS